MNMNMKTTITLSAILIKDKENKGFTSYIAEMPEVIAEGINEEEAQHNLMSALEIVLDVKREEILRNVRPDDENMTVKSFELQTS